MTSEAQNSIFDISLSLYHSPSLTNHQTPASHFSEHGAVPTAAEQSVQAPAHLLLAGQTVPQDVFLFEDVQHCQSSCTADRITSVSP
jgi:hypothetical protein